jgi:glycosyltransferase involved in cell wall biosynthesis
MPRLSVVVDTYNHEAFIGRAIDSVLDQDLVGVEVEVIVVDDGSTDDTPTMVRTFSPRVQYVKKVNGGQGSAFNVGIQKARGEFVVFLDGDDWWERTKLRVVLEAFEQNPEVGMVGHGMFKADREGRRWAVVLPDRTYRLDLRSLEGATRFRQLRTFLGTSRLAIRRNVLEQVLPVPEELVIQADEFIFTMGLVMADAIVLDEALCTYRLHGGNLFMFEGADEERMRRKYAALQRLYGVLWGRLGALGMQRDLVGTALESLRVELEQHRLQLEGGWPWETLQSERAISRLSYQEAGMRYRIFKLLVYALTLIVPPGLFLKLKQWYSRNGVGRRRKVVGEPTPAAPIIERRLAAGDVLLGRETS